MTSVAVLGGGVGGLSAAHELAQRGFTVTVYESRDAFGGKARSMAVPNTGTDGRKHLPGEHGFRFFPSFYRHLVDTMERIPLGAGPGKGNVADNLVETTMFLVAQGGEGKDLRAPAVSPKSIGDLLTAWEFMRDYVFGLGIPMSEFAAYARGLVTLLVSCDERRYHQWEQMSWWDFMEAEERTEPFKKFLADGMTRCLVAARGREMSARTGGMISLRLMLDSKDVPVDRVLNGPTSEVWIDHWVTHLKRLGVEFRGGHAVGGIDCDDKKITGVTVIGPDGDERITADYYIAAMPKERLELLISPQMCTLDPTLAGLGNLQTRWMNGAMYYLDTDVPLEHGHTIFIDSAWSLTAISQQQFWEKIHLTERGDGRVEGILSVDISEWRTPGQNGKVAGACTKKEIRAEVWKQMQDHIEGSSLDEANVIDFFLDPAISFPNPSEAANAEPLLINTPGSWDHRPKAQTAIPNFLLAADFVRTCTDLATMEAANEAARHAVNAILVNEKSTEKPCDTWKFDEPRILRPFRFLDRLLWRLGRKPPKPPVRISSSGDVKASGPVARMALAATRLRR